MRSIAVCIASYRRPQGLRALLASLDALTFEECAPEVRIVVVDNDVEASARRVCDDARKGARHPLTYVHEPRTGIAIARNAAIAAAGDADGIAFVDDDERPAPDWLDRLLRAQHARDADVVTGPVVPRFETSPPAWVVEGGYFESVARPPGALIGAAHTNNTLVRKSCLERLSHGFDERMTPMGEDRELFERVAAAGGRIVWCPEAIVYESVPAERVTLRWLVRRAYRAGVASTRIGRLRRPIRDVAPRIVAHGLWCIGRGLAGTAGGALRGAAASVAGLRLAGFGVGRLTGLALR